MDSTRFFKRSMYTGTGKTFLILTILTVLLSAIAPQTVQALGETPAQVFFLSMPEDQVRTAFAAIDGGTGIGSTMVSITSIAVTVNGTVIYYDQWEDGYEAAITTPVQTSTRIFGDGNTANGNACTYAATLCSGDVLTAGAVLAMRNDVPSNPRGTTTYFDAKDKVATTQVAAVTRAMWDSTTGTVLAGAIQVYDTTGYGTDFRTPVGENFPDTATTTSNTITLRPTGDVSVGSWTEYAAGADADTFRYNEIDETTADGDTTAILSGGTNEYQAATANPTVPADATNISVSIIWRARDNTSNNNTTFSKLRVNGTYYQSDTGRNVNNNSYTDYTDTWADNPASGTGWTPATVNTINGLGFDTSTTNQERITQAYIEITYDIANGGVYDNQMFEYDALLVMAANDNTTVSIDSDGNGTTDYTANLNTGQAYLLNGAASGVTLNSNAHITSNLPIQVNMITGDVGSNYENRWFNIPPLPLWGSSYVTPVGTTNTNAPASVFLYNPNGSAITINYQTSSGSGSFNVAAGGTYRFAMPANSGARFYSSGSPFLAVGTSDTASDTNSGQAWDWGYTLIAEEQLAPSLAVGWAPGDNALPPGSNGSPVWVSAAAATTIYIDYDGNPATGPSVDINGNHYNTSQTVTALQSIRIFDPDRDQTGMKVYTVDGTLLAAAWGEDPSTAGSGNPYLDMGYVVFPLPQMVVTKNGILDVTATMPEDAANAGDVIHYTLVATNQGTRTLHNVSIVDAKLGTLTCTPTQPATLGMGQSMTCTGVYTVTQADIDAGVVYNTAYGDSNETPLITVQDEVKIPKLVVTKTADPTAVPETGGNVTFTFLVKNDNTIASDIALTIKGLTDSVYGTLAGDSDCQLNTVLAPQASCTFTITRWVAGDSAGPDHVNLFTAVAEDDDGTGVSASNDATVDFTDVVPAIALEKYVSVDGGTTWLEADTAPGPYVGSSTAPRFRFVVTNTGPVALSNVDLTDNIYGNISLNGTLAVGASAEYFRTGTWAEGQHTNVATVSGEMTDGAGNIETATATDSANYFGARPALTLAKTASPTTYSAVGQTINYSYVVTNTGNVAADGPVTVSDDKATVTCPSGGLVPGASMTCTAAYTVAQIDLDAGSIKNTATAHANGVNSNTVDVTVTATRLPALSLMKTAEPATYDAVGQVISYTYTIENTGNVTLTGPFSVNDNRVTVTCTQPLDGALSPGEQMTCSASHTITQTDLDASQITNTATATNGTVTSGPATATVNAIARPNLSLVKSAVPGTFDSVGDVIHYNYVVTNIGNVALSTPYSLADDKAQDESCPQTPAPLPVGASITCTATYAITQADLDAGEVLNIATAGAVFGGNPVPSNPSQVTVELVQSPALSIDKTATEANYDAVGDTIHYNYVVTNAGNVTLHDAIVVNDNKALVSCPALPAGGLAPGASISCTASYVIQQSDLDAGALTNIASATSGTTTSPNDTVTVPALQSPHLTLLKSASPATYVAAGETINYTYDLTNDGNVTLVGPFTVTDDKAVVDCPTVESLAVGDTLTCTASHIVSQAEVDGGSITNIASGQAVFGEQPVLSNQDTKTVTAIQSPELTIVKSASPTTYDAVGQVISYSYLVTNSGNVTLYHIQVVDDRANDESCTTPALGLAPGISITCTASYAITQADLDAGSVTNTAHATDGVISSLPDSETVTAIQQGGLGLSKVADVETYDAVGDLITYTYTLENTGNITLSGPFTVNDNRLGAIDCVAGDLAPGASATCTAIYTVLQSDIDMGAVANIATATNGMITSNEANETVAAVQSPALAIDKTAQQASYAHAGDVIYYSYQVTNTGNVTLHDPIIVSDDKADNESCPALPDEGLAPGASILCSASYAVSQADVDAGSLTNVASASSGTTTSPTDTVTVTAQQAPQLTLAKSANPLEYTTVGQEIHYDYLLTNTGNVTLSEPFTVSDDKASVTCPPEVINLAPAETVNCTATYTITQDDLNSGSVTNTASAAAVFAGAPVPSNEAVATVTAVQGPALTLDKTASPTTYDAVGQVISYSYLVTNSGNVTLAGPFEVTDDKATVSCPSTASLAPNASITCTASYTIVQSDLDTGSVINTAAARSSFNGNPVISQPDSETVNAVPLPDLSLVKSADPITYDTLNQTITYTYVLKNIGNVTLAGPFTVSDDKASVTCPTDNTLAVGAELTCTATYAITQADLDAGTVTNVASGHGATLGGTPVNSNNATTTVNADQKPALSIDKSAAETNYDAVGDLIHYSYLVTNTGNVTLHAAITVSDDKALNESCPALPAGGLIPGASITCTATYTIGQPDLDAGSLTNIASAASGAVVSPTDTVTLPAVQTPRLALSKVGTPHFNSPVVVGDLISYTLVATNTGNVTLNAVTVTDPLLGVLSCTPAQPAVLAPDASITCTGSYAVQQADINTGSVSNTGTADSSQTDPVEAPNQVPVPQAPSLTLTKTGALDMTAVAPSNRADEGDLINYTLAATNNGNVTLTNVTISDPLLGALVCTPEQGSSLAPGEIMTCQGSYMLTQADINAGQVNNTATAASNQAGPVQTPTQVTIPRVPSISLTKVADPQIYSAAGQVIGYTMVATNNGNVTLNNVTITDSMAGTLTCTPAQPAALAPGAVLTCTGSYMISQLDVDGGKVTNTAGVAGQPPAGPDVSDVATETVTANQTPALSLTKTGTGNFSNPPAVGDTISYSLVATNTGNITLTNVSITDAKLGALTCTPAQPAALAPGAALTCTGSYVLTQADIDAGHVANTGIADSDQTPPTETPSDVPVPQAPSLSLVKSADPMVYNHTGQVITYTYVVLNTGNVTLHGAINVADDKQGTFQCGTATSLAPGASVTCTSSHFITQVDVDAGSITNTAYATIGQLQSNQASVTVTATQTPAISISKTPDLQKIAQGGTATFTITVSNAGNVTLHDVAVSDLLAPSCDRTFTTLAVGGSSTYTCTLVVAADLTNVATVTATGPAGQPVTASDSAVVDVLPSISVSKSTLPVTVPEPGGMVDFTVVVTNTSSEAVTLNSLVDSVYGDLNGQGTCATGGSIAAGGTYTCAFNKQVSGDAGSSHTNTVTATAADDDGNTANATATATVRVTDVLPAVDLTKTVSPETLPESGGVFTYTLTITNTSVEPVTITALTDSNTLSAGCLAKVGTTLAVGASTSCTYTVNRTEAGTYPNTAGVTVEDNEGNEASDTASASVSVTDVLPTVDLTKTVDPASRAEPGGVFTYTLTIHNTSVEAVTITALTDSNALSAGCLAKVGTTLAAGASTSCTYTVSHTEAGTYPNTADVTVTDNEGNEASDTASASVSVTDVLPAVDLVKTVSPLTRTEPGGLFTYTLSITNTSVEPVTITALTDSNTLSQQCLDLVGDTLAVGQTVTCTYTATYIEAGTYPNTANVTVEDNEGNSASDTASASATVTNVAPVVALTKTVDPATRAEPGGVFTYTLTVTNHSVEAVTVTELTDSNALSAECTALIGQSIPVGGSLSCTYTASYTEAGTYPNTAHVVVTDNEGSTDDATASAQARVTNTLPAVDLTKTVDPLTLPEPGGLFSYTLTITNTSVEAVTITALTDSNTLSQECLDLVGDTLAVGQTVSCTYTKTYTEAGSYPNTANVTVADNEGSTASDSAVATVEVTNTPPLVSIDKSVSPESLPEPGGVFTYTILITNNSVEAVTISALSDTRFTTLPTACRNLIGTTLPVGGTASCTYTQTFTEAGSYTNTAAVTVRDNENSTASASDDATAVVTDVLPTVDLTKTVSPLERSEPGGVFTYTLTITNTSVERVQITALTDTNTLSASCTGLVNDFLAAGASVSCTYTKTYTEAGSYLNTADVTVVDNEENEASDTAEATAKVLDVLPTVDLTKTVTPASRAEPGGSFTYTLTIHNTSVEAVIITELTDSNTLSGSCSALVGTPLVAGASKSCTYTASFSEAGTYLNSAKVTVVDNENNQASDTATATIRITDTLPTVDLTKTVTPLTLAEPGGVFTYTLTIHNTSVEAVIITAVTDSNTLSPECLALVDTMLAAGASTSCTYTASFSEAGTYPNTADVTVRDNEGNSVSDSASASVKVTNVLPDISVTKTADPLTLPEPGGLATFTVVVTNNSTFEAVTLTTLNDNIYGPLAADTALAHTWTTSTCALGGVIPAGGTYTCAFTGPVSGEPKNYVDTVTAIATDNENTTDTATASATVTITDVLPTVDLVKTVTPAEYNEPGGTFTYTLSITNTSVERVQITALTDTNALPTACTGLVLDWLNPGQTVSCTYTSNKSEAGTYANTAKVTVKDNEGNSASDTDAVSVKIIDVKPSVTLTKTVSPASLNEPGGTFTYTLTITNTSVERVEITALTDTHTLSAGCLGKIGDFLAPGASTSCTYTAVYKEAGTYPNTANVTVEDNEANPASAEASATAVVVDVAPTVTLTKTVTPLQRSEPGGIFTYTLTIKNTSPEVVTISALTDTNPLSAACLAKIGTTLAVGASTSCTYTTTINHAGTYLNTANVTVTDNEGSTGTAQATATVKVLDVKPEIAVDKFVNPDEGLLFTGGTAYYTIKVYNLSVEPVQLYSLMDDKFGELLDGTCTDNVGVPFTAPITLAAKNQPGYAFTCFFSAELSGEPGTYHYNTVIGYARDDEGNIDTDSHTAAIKFYWYGLTPGFWKQTQHFAKWPAPYLPTDTVRKYFTVPAGLLTSGKLDLNADGKEDTLINALNYKGGTTVKGAGQILLRAAVAAMLNEVKFGNLFPAYDNVTNLVKDVNAAMATLNRTTMNNLAKKLDGWNNGYDPY